MSPELEQLQTAIKLYLDLTGGPTPQLCVYLLKIIDFLPDPVNSRAEMVELTNRILRNLGVALTEHTGDERLKAIMAYRNQRPVPQDNVVLLTDINRVQATLRSNHVECAALPGSGHQS